MTVNNFSMLFRVMLMLLTLNKSVARIALPIQVITAPQPDISSIFFDKSPKTNGTKPYLLNYKQKREKVIETEELLFTGGRLTLNEKEIQVHQIFIRYKLMELTYGLEHQQENAPALHFFKAKPLIEHSNVYKFIQAMPKGANLHIHRTPSVSADWIVRNLTYMPGLLKCFTPHGNLILSFRMDPKENGCRSKYYLIQDERMRTNLISRYDKYLETKLSLYTRFPEFEYNSIDKVWSRFEDIFSTLSDMMVHEPAFRFFNWQLMQEMYEDNIMYAEIRMKFKPLYGLNGTIVATEYEAIELFMELVDEFKRSHPGFIGLKIIYTQYRGAIVEATQKAFDKFKDYHERYPNFIIGFDLIGQEDKGNSLQSLLPILQNLPKTAKYFFHAGETNWFGTSVDLNLIDAILLNTTRIGHGYALLKHPVLTKLVKEREITLEISPISNQVLNLVGDLRNHPAA